MRTQRDSSREAEVAVAQGTCQYCGAAVTAQAVAEGWCECGKKLSAKLTQKPHRAPETGFEGSARDWLSKLVGLHAGGGLPAPLGTCKRIALALLGLALAGLFGAIGVYTSLTLVEAARGTNWPSVYGRVTESGVNTEVLERRGRRVGERYRVDVKYTYTVNGQEYTGKRIEFGGDREYTEHTAVNARAAEYAPGNPVTVYHDPANPQRAVLQRSVLPHVFGWLGGGLLVGWFGLRLLLTSLLPVMRSTGSVWLPWSRRLTWPDIAFAVVGATLLVIFLTKRFG